LTKHLKTSSDKLYVSTLGSNRCVLANQGTKRIAVTVVQHRQIPNELERAAYHLLTHGIPKEFDGFSNFEAPEEIDDGDIAILPNRQIELHDARPLR
jgi:hypothetical protein